MLKQSFLGVQSSPSLQGLLWTQGQGWGQLHRPASAHPEQGGQGTVSNTSASIQQPLGASVSCCLATAPRTSTPPRVSQGAPQPRCPLGSVLGTELGTKGLRVVAGAAFPEIRAMQAQPWDRRLLTLQPHLRAVHKEPWLGLAGGSWRPTRWPKRLLAHFGASVCPFGCRGRIPPGSCCLDGGGSHPAWVWAPGWRAFPHRPHARPGKRVHVSQRPRIHPHVCRGEAWVVDEESRWQRLVPRQGRGWKPVPPKAPTPRHHQAACS